MAFVSKYGGDDACKDVCRVFYGSYRSDPIILNRKLQQVELDNIVQEYQFRHGDTQGQTATADDQQAGSYPPVSLEQAKEMLQAVVTKVGRPEYMDWLSLASAIWSQFTFEEALPILQECMPEDKPGEYTQKYKHRLKEITIGTLIHKAKECGYMFQQAQCSFLVMDKKGKLSINQKKLLDYLKQEGFCKFYQKDSLKPILLRVVDNEAVEVSLPIIKDFLTAYIKGNFDDDTAHALLQQLICGKYVTLDRIEFIDNNDRPFHKDDQTNTYIYLQDGYIHVYCNADGTIDHKFCDYRTLNGIIWKKCKLPYKWNIDRAKRNIINHGIKDVARPPHAHRAGAGEFEKFFDHVFACNDERKRAAYTMIGYSIVRYKTPSEAKAIILCDEKISDNPAGGTGKSLLATGFSYIRTAAIEDGRKINLSNRFALQNVSHETEIIVFDDVNKDFDFERTFHMITGGFEFERKGKQSIKLPFKESPKLIITTNYTISGDGDSSERRRAEYEIYPFYDKNYSPRHEFGHDFFSEWDDVEWVIFIEFIIHCVKQYMRHGLVVPQPVQLLIRKLIQDTDYQFVEWANDFFKTGEMYNCDVFGQRYTRGQLFNDFCDKYQDFGKDRDGGRFKQNKFTMWLNKYCSYNSIRIVPWPVKEFDQVVHYISFEFMNG